jgi:hypothetical protein
MPEPTTPRRRAKRFLSAEEKYEIWLKILTAFRRPALAH